MNEIILTRKVWKYQSGNQNP